MTPAPSTAITMTVASASTEVKVPYQLFQSSSMRWRLSKARPPPTKSTLSKGRASAAKNAMLRIVARVLIARQHDCPPGIHHTNGSLERLPEIMRDLADHAAGERQHADHEGGVQGIHTTTATISFHFHRRPPPLARHAAEKIAWPNRSAGPESAGFNFCCQAAPLSAPAVKVGL
jgi:hypothetical protein